MIDFVSNLPKDLWTGGFSAMNAAAFAAIGAAEPTRFVGPINPPVFLREKALSKFRRSMGLQGSFFLFSERRLRAITREFKLAPKGNARLNFFHGFTPWILTTPQRPYIAWSDCTFRDYIEIFSHREQFDPKDIDRISEAEATWLSKANRVLFTSQWAVQRAVSQYGLDPLRVGYVGIFGNVERPDQDQYLDGENFVFVSTNFFAKGGPVVLSAFREVRHRHPHATLTIVGDWPKGAVLGPGITLTGFLRKEIPEERQQLRHILSHARAVVHPTSMDIAPLLIIEAGYFGCPVISSRKFAIPELVEHQRTGLLLDDPSDVGAVVQAMCWMLESSVEYERVRQAAWTKARVSHSRSNFEQRLLAYVCDEVSVDLPAIPRPTTVYAS